MNLQNEQLGAPAVALTPAEASAVSRYIVRRLLWGVLLLVIVCALTFVFFRVLPTANPALLRAGATRRRRMSRRSKTSSASTNR